MIPHQQLPAGSSVLYRFSWLTGIPIQQHLRTTSTIPQPMLFSWSTRIAHQKLPTNSTFHFPLSRPTSFPRYVNQPASVSEAQSPGQQESQAATTQIHFNWALRVFLGLKAHKFSRCPLVKCDMRYNLFKIFRNEVHFDHRFKGKTFWISKSEYPIPSRLSQQRRI